MYDAKSSTSKSESTYLTCIMPQLKARVITSGESRVGRMGYLYIISISSVKLNSEPSIGVYGLFFKSLRSPSKLFSPFCQQPRQADIVDIILVSELADVLMVRIQQSSRITGEACRRFLNDLYESRSVVFYR